MSLQASEPEVFRIKYLIDLTLLLLQLQSPSLIHELHEHSTKNVMPVILIDHQIKAISTLN